MKHIGLFEGIGGFSLAGRWMGWETIAWCEWNEFCQQILKYHFPNAKQHGDITKTDFTIYRGKCDILTGGFPCQPYSLAGKRKGKEDNRHLWPEMLRAIREIQPRWIVGENVRGLTNWNGGLVFDEVQADLEAEGYETIPFLLPACAVNAPHRRDRIWIVAYAGSIVSNLSVQQWRQDEAKNSNVNWQDENGASSNAYITSTQHKISTGRNMPASNDTNVTDTKTERLQKWNGKPVQNRTHTTAKRYDCVPQWENFPTVSPIHIRNDGVSCKLDASSISIAKWRTESIKALGNAIVPQVAYEIFKAIESFEKLTAA